MGILRTLTAVSSRRNRRVFPAVCAVLVAVTVQRSYTVVLSDPNLVRSVDAPAT